MNSNDMERIIKFRGYSIEYKEWVYGFLFITEKGLYYIKSGDENKRFGTGIEVYKNSIGQFTGHKTIKDKELYESDIVFVEESEDDKDVRYYLVIVWIPEWSMFASLHLDEYHKFLKEGHRAIDEVMFWTYTLENSETDFHYAGNIFENPELLNL